MKNIFGILGLSLLLTGCFEQPKTEKTDTQTTENKVEVKQETQEQTTSHSVIVESAKTENLETVTNNIVESVEKTTEDIKELAENVKQEVVNTPSNNDVVKTLDSIKSELVVETKEMKENVETDLPVVTQSIIEKEENIVKEVSGTVGTTNVVSNVHRKNVNKNAKTKSTRKLTNNTNGLSPEEQRVGAQRPLTSDEIAELKYKCRYSIMSEKELKFYNCGEKKAIVD